MVHYLRATEPGYPGREIGIYSTHPRVSPTVSYIIPDKDVREIFETLYRLCPYFNLKIRRLDFYLNQLDLPNWMVQLCTTMVSSGKLLHIITGSSSFSASISTPSLMTQDEADKVLTHMVRAMQMLPMLSKRGIPEEIWRIIYKML